MVIAVRRVMVFAFACAAVGCGGAAQRSEPPAANRGVPPIAAGSRIDVADLYHLRTVSDVQLSPDGAKATFTVANNDRPGAPWSQIWIADLKRGQASRWAGAPEGSNARWSTDGSRVAFLGRTGEGKSGILVANADGSATTALADVMTSNSPLPQLGERLAWAPDGTAIAFVSAVPSTDPAIDGDPIVIGRYWYRPATSVPCALQ